MDDIDNIKNKDLQKQLCDLRMKELGKNEGIDAGSMVFDYFSAYGDVKDAAALVKGYDGNEKLSSSDKVLYAAGLLPFIPGGKVLKEIKQEVVGDGLKVLKNSAEDSSQKAAKESVEKGVKDDKYTEWLNKGAINVDVYKGYNDGKDVYAGITNNLKKRQVQHGDRFDISKITETSLTRNQARAVEQVFIEGNSQYLNKINSISPNHRHYNDAINWAKDWLNRMGY